MSLLTLNPSDNLGNLAFYKGPSYKYVYFKSLLTNSGRPNYIQEANRIGREGQSLYSALDGSGNVLESRMTDYSTKWMKLLQFLQTSIQYEQNNEVKFFTQQLQKFNSTFSKDDIIHYIPELPLAKLQKTLEDAAAGNFNYSEFLALVNVIMSGLENAKILVSYEHKRIQEVEDAFQQLRNNRGTQIYGLAKAKGLSMDKAFDFIQDSLDTFDDEIVEYYVEHKNFHDQYNKNGKKVASLRGAEAILKNTKGTSEVELANWINTEVLNIFKSKRMMNHILKYCRTQHIISSQNYDALGTEVLSFLTLTVQAHAIKHMDEILNKDYTLPRKTKEDLIKVLEEETKDTSKYRIQGLFKNNYGVYRKNVKAFDELNRELDMKERSSEGMLSAFERFRNAVDNAAEHKFKLSSDQRSLWKFMDEQGIYKDFEAFSKLLNNLDKYKNFVVASEKRLQHNPELKEIIEARGKKLFKSLGKTATGESVVLELQVTEDGHIKITNLNQIKSLKVFQNIFGDQAHVTLSNLSNAVRNLRVQGGKKLRDKYARALDDATSELKGTAKQKEHKRLNNIIARGLQDIHVSVTGPSLSEILDAISFNKNGQLTVNASGGANAKNDTIVITIDTSTMKIKADMAALAAQRNDTFMDFVRKRMSQNQIDTQFEADLIMRFQDASAKVFAQQANRDHRYKSVASQFINRYKKAEANEIRLQEEERELMKEWQIYKKAMEKKGTAPEEIKKKYEEFLTSLKNSIYVSSTVKTYSHYKNDIGFGGGSIGSNLSTQLGNIFDMFELAGLPITPKDQEWLLGAIINSSPLTVLGESVKHSVENYLGSMAAFMLFDEGGAEAQIIADMQSEISEGLADTNAAILHLYRVNGIYVCGSYVLREVYKQLNECWQMASMALTPNYQGASIRIVNKVSEADIPKNSKSNGDPWGAVGNTALSKVSMEIFFLAGLLDIAEGIETALNNLQLPK